MRQINSLLGAIKHIAASDNETIEASENIQQIKILSYFFLTQEIEIEAIPVSSPVELASLITDNEQKKQALEFLLISCYFSKESLAKKSAIVEDYARALKLSDLLVKQLHQLHFKYSKLILALKLRKNLTEVDNLDLSIPAAAEIKMLYESTNRSVTLTEKYHKLAHLAKNSIGYNLYKFYRKNKLTLPGEPGSMVDKTLLIHDISYLLTDYKRDLRGNFYNLAFLAGNSNTGSIIIAALALFNYYLFERAPEHKPRLNKLEHKRFWNAIRGGMNCQIDLLDNWDYESYFNKSILNVRTGLNLTK